MPLTSSNAVRQLSDANSQGTVLGQSSTDLIAFYGGTPVAQQAVAAISASTVLATSASAASASGYGFSSAAQMNAIVTGINALIVDVAAIRGSLTSTGLAG